ncbi:MAG: phage holin family protein [Prevotella sp.]|nr:phage holin family protein [Prevotella sp.]
MFSNDKNVETIAHLVEVLKHYIGLQSEYVRLDVIEKVVRLLTVIAVAAVFVTLFLISLIYFSFAAVYALQPLVGSFAVAFLIVSAAYLLVLILFVLFRHRLIERPLVRFLGSLLMSK